MGSDVHYHCRTSSREQVERMVAVTTLYAREHDLPCRLIDLRNCALQETGRWDWPDEEAVERRALTLARDLIALGRGGARGEPLDKKDLDRISAERQLRLDYFSGCQRSADLYGIAFPPLLRVDDDEAPEILSHGQLLFDFKANGILVNCTIDPSLDHATGATVPCRYLRVDGHWRSFSDHLAFPRFLTLCQIRYLPALDFGSDYDEKFTIMREFADRDVNLDALREMSDEEFYEAWLKGREIIG